MANEKFSVVGTNIAEKATMIWNVADLLSKCSEARMKQISNKEYEQYQQYQTDKLHGRILTPDGLRLICASFDNDPEQIGKHMLEMLAKFKTEGIVE